MDIKIYIQQSILNKQLNFEKNFTSSKEQIRGAWVKFASKLAEAVI
jgi:hypothetical protein